MRYHEKNGITLIALVITVIILLILASIAISLITGQNGLFARTNMAGYTYNTAAYEEKGQVEGLYGYLNQYSLNDLEILREYYAKGWDVINWSDENTLRRKYNNIEPIMDADSSIHEIYGDETYIDIKYNNNYYKINHATMEVSYLTEDDINEQYGEYGIGQGGKNINDTYIELFVYLDKLYLLNFDTDEYNEVSDLDIYTYGIFNIEGFGEVLITPSSCPYVGRRFIVHSNYRRDIYTVYSTGEEIDAYMASGRGWSWACDVATGECLECFVGSL